jgi:hypothetical protein
LIPPARKLVRATKASGLSWPGSGAWPVPMYPAGQVQRKRPPVDPEAKHEAKALQLSKRTMSRPELMGGTHSTQEELIWLRQPVRHVQTPGLSQRPLMQPEGQTGVQLVTPLPAYPGLHMQSKVDAEVRTHMALALQMLEDSQLAQDGPDQPAAHSQTLGAVQLPLTHAG